MSNTPLDVMAVLEQHKQDMPDAAYMAVSTALMQLHHDAPPPTRLVSYLKLNMRVETDVHDDSGGETLVMPNVRMRYIPYKRTAVVDNPGNFRPGAHIWFTMEGKMVIDDGPFLCVAWDRHAGTGVWAHEYIFLSFED